MLRHQVRVLLIAIIIGSIPFLAGRDPRALAGGPPTGPLSPSPEEAVISLLPHELGAQDSLPNYTIGMPEVSTVSDDAFDASDPWDAFNREQSAGLLVLSVQTLSPSGSSSSAGGGAGQLQVSVFANPARAATYATGQSVPPPTSGIVAFQTVQLKAPLGEAGSAWSITPDLKTIAAQLGVTLPANSPAASSYYFRWQRGAIVYELTTPSNLSQQEAETLAGQIDSLERSRPALVSVPATVTPPASEAQRLEAGLQLKPLLDGLTGPNGYTAQDTSFSHPAEDVATDADPSSELRTLDTSWRRVSSVDRVFRGSQGSLFVSAGLDGDPPSTAKDVEDEQVDSGWTTNRIDAPLRLGDVTDAYLDSGPGPDGKAEENRNVHWTHGSLLLSVQAIGAAGTTSMDTVVPLAQQLEAAFQASSAPTSGPPLTLSDGWNLVAGTGQYLAGDQYGPAAYTYGPTDSAYETSSNPAPLQSGHGYWVDAIGDGPIPLRAGSSAPYQVQAAAGQPFLIGNPSGMQPATVSGADSVMTYDPVSGYHGVTSLEPGQAAWVLSNSGGVVTVTPQGTPPPPSLPGAQTVSSAKGYFFSAPADWQQGPPSASFGLTDVDTIALSTDGTAYAFVTAISAPSGSGVNVIRALDGFNTGVGQDDPSFRVITDPKLTDIAVPGADNAAYTVDTYTGSKSGKTHVEIVVAANRNETVYLFDVDVLAADFDQNQQQIWQIADSLQLSQPAATP